MKGKNHPRTSRGERWRLACMALVVPLALAGVAVQVGSRIQADRNFREIYHMSQEFQPDARWPDYQLGLPLEEMDFSQYGELFTGAVPLIGYETEITLGSDLTYYQERAGEKVPAFTLPAGTQVEAGSFLYLPCGPEELGCGFRTFPSYEKGWRWAKPFVEAGEEAASDQTWYYVKTRELEQAALGLWESHSMVRSGFSSKQEFAWAFVRRTDGVFYANGVVHSPDLHRPVWTWPCTLLAVAAIGDLAALALLRRSRFRG